MAFPTSPNNGDLYNGYEYDSTIEAWLKTSSGSFAVSIESTDTSGTVSGISSQECVYKRTRNLVHVSGNIDLSGSGVIAQGDAIRFDGFPYPIRRLNSLHRSLGVFNFYATHGSSENAIGDALALDDSNNTQIESEVIAVDGTPAWNEIKVSFNFTYEIN